jgi:thymidylate synthase
MLRDPKKRGSRRAIVSAWNAPEINGMALPPCHTMYQFNVQPTKKGDRLDCKMYQRSADTFLGVPFNTPSYALLTEMIAKDTDMIPGFFIHTFGDAHLYCGEDERGAWYGENLEKLKKDIHLSLTEGPEKLTYVKKLIENEAPEETEKGKGQDHVPMVLEQLSRDIRPLPKLHITPNKSLEEITIDDLKLKGYNPHPSIKGSMAV